MAVSQKSRVHTISRTLLCCGDFYRHHKLVSRNVLFGRLGGPSTRPSWSLFRTFVRLLSHQLLKVERYPLLGAEVTRVEGLETFR